MQRLDVMSIRIFNNEVKGEEVIGCVFWIVIPVFY
jgi:hypothetical protein